MDLLCLDFETYFDKDYTLKKLTTEEYVRDARFESHLIAWKTARDQGWIVQEGIADFLKLFNPATTACLAHHAQFDGLILSHHYGWKPARWLDTMSMARVALGTHRSASLANLAQHFGLSEKTVPYEAFKGRRWCNLDQQTRDMLGAGAVHDCNLTWEIFNRLQPLVPAEELLLIDATVKMFTEPKLVGDVAYLQKFQHDEAMRKQEALAELGVTAADLQSADKFCTLLEGLGIDVEMKRGTNGEIPAIAKTDEFMKGLLDHADETVALLAESRLDVKSTLNETRAGRFAGMAQRGAMCVYLAHAAAHTKRDGGGDKCNWQNLPRTKYNEDGSPKPTLKQGICAPKGYLIANPDASQIECRVLNYVAGQADIVEAFRAKRDIYSDLATRFYGFPVTKADQPRRGVGKQLELSCGYGAGGNTIVATAKRGTYGPPVHLSPEEGVKARDVYRESHRNVVELWGEAGRVISALAGTEKPVRWCNDLFTVETGRMTGPTGLVMHYPNLQFEETDHPTFGRKKGWRYDTRRGRVHLYGGKLVENAIQHLARCATFGTCARILREAPTLHLVNREHDKLVWLVPDDQYAEPTLQWLLEQMRRPPSWLPSIPLDAEGELSERYG